MIKITGHIHFHGAKEGHKMDCLKQFDKASFCVMDKSFKKDGEWAVHYQNVIVFGKIKMVNNPDKVKEMCTQLCPKFTNDQNYIDHELKYSDLVYNVLNSSLIVYLEKSLRNLN